MSPGPSHIRLEVISGNAVGATITVDDELVIGRHADGAGRLSEDEEISRQHARISREATGDYAIEDLGSSNGTFVNGLRIQSPRLLSLGDSVEAGATTLVVREIVQPEPLQPAPLAADSPAASVLAAPTVFARSPVAQPAAGSAWEPPAEPAAATGPPVPADASPTRGELAGATRPLALELEVDFDAREARIRLGDGGETVRMIFEDGAWRAGTEGSDPSR